MANNDFAYPGRLNGQAKGRALLHPVHGQAGRLPACPPLTQRKPGPA
jgi:hypothetical protein